VAHFAAIPAASPPNVTIYDGDFVVRDVGASAAALAGVPRSGETEIRKSKVVHIQRA
jgi:hypothetical protein